MKFGIAMACTCLVISGTHSILAQTTPSITPTTGPGNLGTTVTQAGNTSTITGGTRPSNGPNLFHSFGEFGVPTSHLANFLNDTALPTSNILSRVTGGNPSTILGTIQTTGFGSANLFLMNPAGIVFGPSASLNVGGSATFTTADYLRLADGAKFTAMPGSADAAISSAPVAAFGFLGTNPGAITVQGGHLRVSDGHGISLVGGNIEVTAGTLENGTTQSARISAPGGQVNVVSLGSAGEVSFNGASSPSGTPALDGVTTLGNISLVQGASIDTSADAAGRIVVRGGQLIMEDASLKAISVNGLPNRPHVARSSPAILIAADKVDLSNGTLITADTHGSTPAGDITLRVDTLTTRGGLNTVQLNPTDPKNANGNLIASDSRSVSPEGGHAGNITIEGVDGHGTAARNVLLKDTTVSSRIFGGTPETVPSVITITADSIEFTNAGLPVDARAATIVANTIGPAPAADIFLNANTILGNVNPDGTPISGAKTVFIITSNNSGSTAGSPGTITISGVRPEHTDAARLVALDNIFISSGADGGTATTAPGGITITADTVSLSNDTGIITTTFGEATTPSGNIALNVNTLRAHTLADGTQVNGKPQVFIVTLSESGQAGTITISGIGPENSDAAQLLALNNIEVNSVVLGGTPTTPRATISLNADMIQITNSKNIKADTRGGAPAGNIDFKTTTFLVDQASKISSSTSAAGPGGNISIAAGESVTVRGGTSITVASTGPANAGNITINQGLSSPASSVLIDGAGSAILTNTVGTGAGGNTNISAQTLTIQNGGTISASTTGTAPSATGGNIAISSVQFTTLNNGSISASSAGPANAGNITINAGSQFMMSQNASVTTEASQASGGDITIQATDAIRLVNSTISTSVQGGPETSGGNITIDPAVMTLQNSQILAQAVQGQGGNINITAGTFLADPTSLIDASSQFGLSGAVNIQSPVAMLSGTLATLPKQPLPVQHLLQQRCAAQVEWPIEHPGRFWKRHASFRARAMADESAGSYGGGSRKKPNGGAATKSFGPLYESSQPFSRWIFVPAHQQLGRRLSLTYPNSTTCTYPIRYGYQSARMRET